MAGMPESAKGIMNWVLVIGIIAFILLLFGIIFGNMTGNVGLKQDSVSFINETINLTDAGEIPATADDSTKYHRTLSNVRVYNASSGEIINSGNYTISGVTFTNATSEYGDRNVNVSATLNYDSQAIVDTNDVIQNYTEAGTNTAAQLPTVGTIVGIVLLIIILLSALVFVIMKLTGITEKSGASTVKPQNTKFGDSNGRF